MICWNNKNGFKNNPSNTLIEEHSGGVQVSLPVHFLMLILVNGRVLVDCVFWFLDLRHLDRKNIIATIFDVAFHKIQKQTVIEGSHHYFRRRAVTKLIIVWVFQMLNFQMLNFPIDHHLVLEQDMGMKQKGLGLLRMDAIESIR